MSSKTILIANQLWIWLWIKLIFLWCLLLNRKGEDYQQLIKLVQRNGPFEWIYINKIFLFYNHNIITTYWSRFHSLYWNSIKINSWNVFCKENSRSSTFSENIHHSQLTENVHSHRCTLLCKDKGKKVNVILRSLKYVL